MAPRHLYPGHLFRVADKQLSNGLPAPPEHRAISTEFVRWFQSVQELVTAAHADLAARISTIQDTVSATQNQTIGIATSLQQLDVKLDNHVECLQSYQHQLCQALHTDIHRMNTLHGPKDLGSRPPASVVEGIARLAGQAPQLYQGST